MQSGERVGTYEVRSLLGRGGMAEVYKVWNPGLQRMEALKAIPAHMAYDKTFVERFFREARTAAALHHPNIATIYAFSEEGAAQPFFTMELVAGGDIAALLAARGRLLWNDAIPLLTQSAAALDYAHAKGIIHRDIKPGNLLLEDNGQGGWNVKVVDFGIARASEESGGKRLTKTGMVVGTPDYMSPEQAGSGAPVDHRTDIYSLGIVAYEMLCGYTPFGTDPEASAFSIAMHQMKDPPRPLIEFVPGLPAGVNNAILRALAKNPADRFASCSEFVAALSGAPVAAAAPTRMAPSVGPRDNSPAATQAMPGGGIPAQPAYPQATRVAQPSMQPQGMAQPGAVQQQYQAPYQAQNVPVPPVQTGPTAYGPPKRQSWVPFAVGLAALAVASLAGMMWMNGSHGAGDSHPTTVPSASDEPADDNATGADHSDSNTSSSDNSGSTSSSGVTDDNSASPVETAAITPLATAPSATSAPHPHATTQNASGAMPGERYPETRTRYLSQEEVQPWSYAKVRYALNEIYARHGLRFQTPAIRQQFAQFSWYHPATDDQGKVEASFNEFERANKELLGQMRDTKKEDSD